MPSLISLRPLHSPPGRTTRAGRELEKRTGYGMANDAYLTLPLNDTVKQKWLGGNAEPLFNID